MVKTTLQVMRNELLDHAKILVFCKSAAEANKWAREYKAKKYYHDLTSKDGEWETGKGGLMFATTAIGAGMDKDGIQRAMQIGSSY
jgi:hypothetical protein